MKNNFVIFALVILLFAANNVYSCFMDQPQNMLPKIVSADFSNGASWEVQFPNRKTDKILNVLFMYYTSFLAVYYSKYKNQYRFLYPKRYNYLI